MSQSQIHKATTAAGQGGETACLSLGARDDVAEQRVDRELSANPTLRNLHGGQVAPAGRSAAGGAAHSVPSDLSRTLEGGGEPLAEPLRRDMESAYRADFSHVRVHRGGAAERASRQMGAAAFAADGHIGFAKDLYRPETAAGRGLIAHELGHVAEQDRGADRAGVVRRNIFERIGDFFAGAGEDYSTLDISQYLRVLKGGDIENNTDSDNKARFVVKQGWHKTPHPDEESIAVATQPEIRALLVKEMATGIVAKRDENAILQVLEDASPIDLEIIVNTVGRKRLLKKIDDKALKLRLEGLILQVNNAEETPLPVSWQLNHRITGAEENAQSERGLFVNTFKVKPAGGDDFRTLTRDVSVPHRTGQDFKLANALPHPRNKAGEGIIDFQIGRTEGPRVVLRPDQTEQLRHDGSGSYPIIPVAEDQTVEANLDVELENKEVPDTAIERSQTVAIEDVAKLRAERSRVQTDTAGLKESSGSSVSLTDGGRDVTGIGLSNKKGSSAEIGADARVSGEVGADARVKGGRTDTTEDETTNQFTGSVTFTNQITGTVGTEIKTTLAGELGLSLDGLLDSLTGLSQISNKTIRKLLSLAGKAGGALSAVLSLVDKANLTLGIDSTNRFSITGTITGEAALQYQRTHRELTRATTQSEAEVGANAKVGAEAGVSGRLGATNEDQVNLNRQFETNFEDTVSSNESVERSIQRQIAQGESTAVEFARTDRVEFSVKATSPDRKLVTTVKDAKLTFNVQGQPRPESESKKEEGED